jgi:FkbM family methyltransferase
MKYTENLQRLKKIIDEIITKPQKFFKYGKKSKKFIKLRIKILRLASEVFGPDGPQRIHIKKIGIVHIPFFSYGNITSTNMWELEDMILFGYYLKKSNYYNAAYDLGANIGFHSIFFFKSGYKKITCFEPEKDHLRELKKNLKLNNSQAVKVCPKAVFNKSKKIQFNKIHGNTTSSHILNAKKNPYGIITKYYVESIDFKYILPKKGMSIFKIDIENVEGVVIKRTVANDWKFFDAFVEVGDKENAKKIFEHCKKIKINIFAHKIKWKKVKKFTDMPESYHDGLVFLSKSNDFNLN